MNIYTVRDNLKTTIAGKEKLLEEYKKASLIAVRNDTPDRVTIAAMAGFLSTNIDELKRILKDVEQCCEKANYDSWRENPDRMGGQFTQDEIDNANRWI
jgi:hypothetical protein